MKTRLLLGLCLCLQIVHAKPAWTLESFEASARENDPILKESKASNLVAKYEYEQLKYKMILPRLRASAALGPAPGISQKIDSVIVDGEKIAQTRQHYDFTSLGPYFGMELEFAQPLNINRLRLGLSALKLKADVKQYEIDQVTADKSQSYQEAFFQYQYALSMRALLNEVISDLGKVRQDLQSKSDSGDADATNQLLEIDAASFEIDEGDAKVVEGLSKAERGFKFLLADTSSLALVDSNLTPRPEKLPTLDQVKKFALTHNSELKQLRAGLKAKSAVVELKQNELGPEFFLFGSIKFAKSWARDRQGTTGDVFQQDPLNTVEGALGIGARFDLNLWSKIADMRQAELDLKQLRRKDSYAEPGILLQLEDIYNNVIMHQKRLTSAEKAVNASDALLTNASAVFDVDPSQSKALMDAYKRHVNNRKVYLGTVLDYNIALSKLIAKSGSILPNFREQFGHLSTNP